jgi:hypothetical protein
MKILITKPFRMNFRNILLFCIWVFSILQITSGYSQNNDFQSWNSIEIEKKVTNDFSLSIEEELRFSNNSTSFNESHTNISGYYSFNKILKAGLGYRYSFTRDIEDGNVLSHRVLGDVFLKYKFSDFIFSFRELIQCDWQGEKTSPTASYPELYLRHKFQIKYNVPKVALFPFIEAEFFQSMNNPVKNNIDKYRLTGGFEYKFENRLAISIFYRYQDTQKILKKRNHIYLIGTGVSYQF